MLDFTKSDIRDDESNSRITNGDLPEGRSFFIPEDVFDN